MKIWRPDTCECEVEELYEGDSIKGGGAVLRKCAVHTDVPDAELYGVLYANPDGENKRKNQMHRALLGLEGSDMGLHEDVVDAEGQTVRQFKTGVNFDWSFTGTGKDRVLNVTVRGATLTGPRRAALNGIANAKFGTGKVNLT